MYPAYFTVCPKGFLTGGEIVQNVTKDIKQYVESSLRKRAKKCEEKCTHFTFTWDISETLWKKFTNWALGDGIIYEGMLGDVRTKFFENEFAKVPYPNCITVGGNITHTCVKGMIITTGFLFISHVEYWDNIL